MQGGQESFFQRPALINWSLEQPVLMAKMATMLSKHATYLVLLTRWGHTLSAKIKASSSKLAMM